MKKYVKAKKIVAVGLFMVSAFSLAGCDNDSSSNVDNEEKTEKSKTAKYLMDTDRRRITEDDIKDLKIDQLNLIKNEILARNGFVFSSDEYMKNYFSNMIWYEADPDFSISDLSDIEKDNYNFIEDYIKKMELATETTTEITTKVQEEPKTEVVVKYIPQEIPYQQVEKNSYQTNKIYYCCATDFITLRSAASTKSIELAKIYPRDSVEYLGSEGAFYRVRYGGIEGYALSKFLSENIDAPLLSDPR